MSCTRRRPTPSPPSPIRSLQYQRPDRSVVSQRTERSPGSRRCARRNRPWLAAPSSCSLPDKPPARFRRQPELKPEQADSFTFGFVLNSPWTSSPALERLSPSVDYWSIDLEDVDLAARGRDHRAALLQSERRQPDLRRQQRVVPDVPGAIQTMAASSTWSSSPRTRRSSRPAAWT